MFVHFYGKEVWYNMFVRIERLFIRRRKKMNVFDVAKYILEHNGGMTTMKLQKLVYYCQAWSLAWDDVPLFDEDFQAWANGPVCPELYNKHRGLFEVDANWLANMKPYNFTDSQLETINTVLEHYGSKEPHWLSEQTHHETPWIEARDGTPAGERSNNIITKESMQEYYGGLI